MYMGEMGLNGTCKLKFFFNVVGMAQNVYILLPPRSVQSNTDSTSWKAFSLPAIILQ